MHVQLGGEAQSPSSDSVTERVKWGDNALSAKRGEVPCYHNPGKEIDLMDKTVYVDGLPYVSSFIDKILRWRPNNVPVGAMPLN